MLLSIKQNYAIIVYAKIAKKMIGVIKIPIYVRVVLVRTAEIYLKYQKIIVLSVFALNV